MVALKEKKENPIVNITSMQSAVACQAKQALSVAERKCRSNLICVADRKRCDPGDLAKVKLLLGLLHWRRSNRRLITAAAAVLTYIPLMQTRCGIKIA
jgi:hypothetical protein